MANLIITIISIALVAVAVAMAAYYGGLAFQNYQPQAWANAAISQNQQLVAAANAWSLDHNGSTWDNIFINNLMPNYLSQIPPLVMAPSANSNFFYQDLNSLTPACPSINGYRGNMRRAFCGGSAGNFIWLLMVLNDPYNGTCNSANIGNGYGLEDTRYNNHPYVQLAKAINKITGATPAGANMSASGIPNFPAHIGSNATTCSIAAYGSPAVYTNESGNLAVNYCYLANYAGGGHFGSIMCFFNQ